MPGAIAWFLLIFQLFVYSSPEATNIFGDMPFTLPFAVFFWLLFVALWVWAICCFLRPGRNERKHFEQHLPQIFKNSVFLYLAWHLLVMLFWALSINNWFVSAAFQLVFLFWRSALSLSQPRALRSLYIFLVCLWLFLFVFFYYDVDFNQKALFSLSLGSLFLLSSLVIHRVNKRHRTGVQGKPGKQKQNPDKASKQ